MIEMETMNQINRDKYNIYRKPDYIIIGSQKCGTTSLYYYLTHHPRIRPAIKKEIHFFSDNYERGLQWYNSCFPPVGMFPGFITGEGSPYYIFHPLAPQRLRTVYPGVKLILLLRNPADRAYSHYHFNLLRKKTTHSFEEDIAREEGLLAGEKDNFHDFPNYKSNNYRNFSYLSRGRYVEQLRHWCRFFPLEQFLIIKSEDFFRSPGETLEQVFSFLGLENAPVSNLKRWLHVGYPPINPDTRVKLVDYFRPYNRQLYEFLGRDFEWEEEERRKRK
jgi:hypothetical protein